MAQPCYPTSSRGPSDCKVGTLLLIYAVLLCVLMSLAGCNGKTVSKSWEREEIRNPRTQALVWFRESRAGGTQELPPNAAGPTTMSVGDGVVSMSTAGTHATTPEQIVAKGRVWFVGAGALFAVIGLAALVIPGLKAASIPAFAISAAFVATPFFFDSVGWWLLPAAGLSLVAWVAWFISQRSASVRSSRLAGKALAEADAAAGAGDKDQAVDLMRSAMAALAVNKPEFAKAAGKVPK